MSKIDMKCQKINKNSSKFIRNHFENVFNNRKLFSRKINRKKMFSELNLNSKCQN